MQTTTDTTLDTKLSAIDRALAAAKARKAARTENAEASPTTASAPPKEPKAKKETHPEFAKAQRAEALKTAREEAKKIREADREARRAAKAAQVKGPVHMKKVDRAAARLPPLESEQARLLFNEITTNYSAAQVSAIALHLQHFNRQKATERAVSQQLEVGARVRITSGDPRYIGVLGTVTMVRRIRCFVEVPNAKKPIYLFTSDVVREPAEQVETALAS